MLVSNHFDVKEVPPKKGTFVTLDDSDDSDEWKGRNKGIPDIQKMEKVKAKNRIEVTSLRKKIIELMKLKEKLMDKQLEANMPH
jgi:hypothetical protein